MGCSQSTGWESEAESDSDDSYSSGESSSESGSSSSESEDECHGTGKDHSEAAIEALKQLGIPNSLPDAVGRIISGGMADTSVDWEKFKEEGRAAMRWLMEAAKLAHLHPDIKSTARRLAAQGDFTRNLEAYNMGPDDEISKVLMDHMRDEFGSHLTSLGSQLEALYRDQQLGVFYSQDAIDNTIVFYNPDYKDAPEPTQGIVMPAVQSLYDYSDAAPAEEMNEDKFLHAVMMVARLADPSFQARVLGVAARFGMSKEDKSFQASAPKSRARCAGKMLSVEDHRNKSSPRPGHNVDVIRNLAAPAKDKTKPFLKSLLEEFNGCVKFKNLYALPDAERAERFHLVSLMVSVVHKTGQTFGEMMSTPESKKALDEYCDTPPKGTSAERWRRHTSEVRTMLETSASVRDTEVCVIGEVQILLEDVVKVRHEMHEPYKYYRAEDGEKLYADIVNSMKLPADEEEGRSVFSASMEGQVSVVRRLLAEGEDVDEGNGNATPLYIASQNNHPDVAAVLLSAGADVDKANDNGVTPLNIACQNGFSDCARLLIDKGADVDKARDGGYSPLYVACQKGFSDCARLIIDKDADVHKANDNGVTPLNIACQGGFSDCARLIIDKLIDKAADVDKAVEDNGETLLYIACQEGFSDCARLLIDRGADVDKADDDGMTPLSMACQGGFSDCARLLIDNGADVNKADDEGQAPLYMACYMGGSSDCARLLIDNGADVDKVKDNGNTPLIIACHQGFSDCARLLINANADASIKSKYGTALDIATREGHNEIAEMLAQ